MDDARHEDALALEAEYLAGLVGQFIEIHAEFRGVLRRGGLPHGCEAAEHEQRDQGGSQDLHAVLLVRESSPFTLATTGVRDPGKRCLRDRFRPFPFREFARRKGGIA